MGEIGRELLDKTLSIVEFLEETNAIFRKLAVCLLDLRAVIDERFEARGSGIIRGIGGCVLGLYSRETEGKEADPKQSDVGRSKWIHNVHAICSKNRLFSGNLKAKCAQAPLFLYS